MGKTILELIISVYTICLKTQEERTIKARLADLSTKQVKMDTEQYVLVRELLILRRERAFNVCEFLIYFARLMLLTSALKLPGSRWLNPVFVASCGLFQSGMQVFKSMRGKKHFHKLTIEDVKQHQQQKMKEALAADKLQTILVPIEKNKTSVYRSRGYSASLASEFNFGNNN